MGEIADLMLNGDICSICGCEMGDGDGFGRICAGCRRDEKRPPRTEQPRNPFHCPVCGYKVKKPRSWEAVLRHGRSYHATRPELVAHVEAFVAEQLAKEAR